MRLIDAEALENEIVKTMRYVPKDAVLDVACMVNRAPTIEAKPVVHGRNLSADTPSQFECSVCGCEDWDTYTCDVDVYKYCPKCGAQMDEKEGAQK